MGNCCCSCLNSYPTKFSWTNTSSKRHYSKPSAQGHFALTTDYLNELKAKLSPETLIFCIDLVGIHDCPDGISILGLSGPYVEMMLLHPDEIADRQIQRSSFKAFDRKIVWVRA
jgi:hypothetical protein